MYDMIACVLLKTTGSVFYPLNFSLFSEFEMPLGPRFIFLTARSCSELRQNEWKKVCLCERKIDSRRRKALAELTDIANSHQVFRVRGLSMRLWEADKKISQNRNWEPTLLVCLCCARSSFSLSDMYWTYISIQYTWILAWLSRSTWQRE